MSKKLNGVEYARLALKALASERNLKIFFALQSQSRLWSELMFQFKLNPKSLNDALKKLVKRGLVRKKEYGGYEVTEFGVKLNEVIRKLLEIQRFF